MFPGFILVVHEAVLHFLGYVGDGFRVHVVEGHVPVDSLKHFASTLLRLFRLRLLGAPCAEVALPIARE